MMEIECITELVIEQHRFLQGLKTAMGKMDLEDQQKIIRQSRWLTVSTEKALEKLGMKLVDFTGARYEPGLPVTAVNQGKIISEMLEPVIMKDEEVVHTGVAFLREE